MGRIKDVRLATDIELEAQGARRRRCQSDCEGRVSQGRSPQASLVNLKDTFVVLDTSVLLKHRVSDVLVDLRLEKVFSAHWTEEIDIECNMQEAYGITETRIQNRLCAMKARCLERGATCHDCGMTPMSRVTPTVDH
jgi:hypothetical protein